MCVEVCVIVVELILFKDCVYMFLETVVKKIFDEEKEEMMLLKLFEQMLKLEYDACINIGEFMRSNTTFTKMLATMLA